MPCLGGKEREREKERERRGNLAGTAVVPGYRERREPVPWARRLSFSPYSLSLSLFLSLRLFFTVRSLRCSVLPASSFLLSRATESIRLCSTGEVTTGHRLNQSVRFSLASPSIVRLVLIPSSRFLPTFERTPCYVARAAALVSGILLASVRRSYACTRYPDYAES